MKRGREIRTPAVGLPVSVCITGFYAAHLPLRARIAVMSARTSY